MKSQNLSVKHGLMIAPIHEVPIKTPNLSSSITVNYQSGIPNPTVLSLIFSMLCKFSGYLSFTKKFQFKEIFLDLLICQIPIIRIQ